MQKRPTSGIKRIVIKISQMHCEQVNHENVSASLSLRYFGFIQGQTF